MAHKANTFQKLLWSGEYKEFEDVVLAEGEFLEIDPGNDYVQRLVLLGMTANNLIIAERHITNYKEDPEVYYLTDVDLDLDGLEVSSVLPIFLIRMDNSYFRYELVIRVFDRTRYYELTNTRINGDLEQTWEPWLERVLYLREDPDGYIRAQCDQYEIPYPEYYVTNEKARAVPADDTLIWKLIDLDAVEMLEKDIAISKAITASKSRKLFQEGQVREKKGKTKSGKKKSKKPKKKWYKCCSNK